jgi:hypothetical protein
MSLQTTSALQGYSDTKIIPELSSFFDSALATPGKRQARTKLPIICLNNELK